jgi:hypothetical protein
MIRDVIVQCIAILHNFLPRMYQNIVGGWDLAPDPIIGELTDRVADTGMPSEER